MKAARRPWIALLLICLAMFCAFLAVFSIPPIIGALTRQFHIDYSKAGLFMTAYAMIPVFASFLAGTLSDRIGVRRMLLAGLGMVAAAGYLSSLAQKFDQMLACRILIGIGATGIFVPSLSTVLSLLDLKNVNLATGAFFGSLNLGLSAALLTTPIIASVAGWRTPLRVFAALPAALAVFLILRTKDEFFRSSGEWERAAEAPRALYPRRSGRALILVSGGNFLLFFQSFAMITWLPEYLKAERGYGPSQVGSVSMLLGLIVIPGSFLAGWLADRVGAWEVAVAGAAICTVCPTLLPLMPGAGIASVSADVLFISLGTSLLTIPLTSVVRQLIPANARGRAVGLVLTTGYAGAMFSTYGGGYLLARARSYAPVFAGCSIAMLLTLVLLGCLRGDYRRMESGEA